MILLFDCCVRSKEFREFLSLCLVKNPGARSSAADLLLHAFISGVEDNKPLRILYLEVKSEVQEIVEELSEDADLLHDPEHTEEIMSESQSISETTLEPATPNEATPPTQNGW